MKQGIALFALVLAALELGGLALGVGRVLLIVHGAMAIMAVMIAATFLWLWFERTTPLALGMVFTWAGTAMLIGWGWGWGTGSGWPAQAGLVVQAAYIVGALLHFAVIHRSFGFRGPGFVWPVVLAFALSGTGVLI